MDVTLIILAMFQKQIILLIYYVCLFRHNYSPYYEISWSRGKERFTKGNINCRFKSKILIKYFESDLIPLGEKKCGGL